MPGRVPGIHGPQHGKMSGGWVNIRYGLTRLDYSARRDDIATAIRRNMFMHHWSRAWKANLIVVRKPDWFDLYRTLP